MLFVLSVGFLPLISSDTATNVQTFLTNIAQPPLDETKYDPVVRPKTNQDEPLVVTMNIGITAIMNYRLR